MSAVNLPEFNLESLAQLISGEYIGDKNKVINGFSPDPELAKESQLCFVFSKQYINKLNAGELSAGIYIIPATAKITQENINYIKVQKPKLVIKQLLDAFAPKRKLTPQGVHATAIIDSTSNISETARVSAQVYIGENTCVGDNVELMPGVKIGSNVIIKDNTVIKYNTVIEDNCIIGSNVIIHPNCTIGSDGFSFVTEKESVLEILQSSPSTSLEDIFVAEDHENNPHLKVISAGSVIIEDNVEIGANTCIDRGTLGATIIGQGTKIDNLNQIAHNARIGKDCLIVAQAGIAGSAKLEDRVVVAGHAGCKDGITIGHDSILLATSHANRDAKPLSLLGGNPAIPAKDYMSKEKQLMRIMRQFPKLKEQVESLLKE